MRGLKIEKVQLLLPKFKFTLAAIANNLETQQPSCWKTSGLKDMSFKGYDVRNGGFRLIDYGNFSYAVFAYMMMQLDGDVRFGFERLARFYSSLAPDAMVTSFSTERVGDIIEVFMAALRGEPAYRDETISGASLVALNQTFLDIMRAMDEMQAYLKTGQIFSTGRRVQLLSSIGCCDDSLGVFSRVFLNAQSRDLASLLVACSLIL